MPAAAARPRAPYTIFADGDDGVRRYLRYVDDQVEWGGAEGAHEFTSRRAASATFIAVGLSTQPRFGIEASVSAGRG